MILYDIEYKGVNVKISDTCNTWLNNEYIGNILKDTYIKLKHRPYDKKGHRYPKVTSTVFEAKIANGNRMTNREMLIDVYETLKECYHIMEPFLWLCIVLSTTVIPLLIVAGLW